MIFKTDYKWIFLILSLIGIARNIEALDQM